jgi:hypothetical protein
VITLPTLVTRSLILLQGAPIKLPGPNASNVPNSSAFLTLFSGAMWLALLASALGIVYGAGYIALGHFFQNSHQQGIGKRIVISGLVAAAICGGVQGLITFSYNLGGGGH